MFILYKATEVLSRTTFFNHTLLSSSSGAKDKKRLELKEDRWMELRDQVCDRFLVIFCGSHCGLSISRNFATDIYNIAMLFFRPDCVSLLESGKLEFFHLRNIPKHRKQRAIQIYSLKQTELLPTWFDLKKMSSHLSLPPLYTSPNRGNMLSTSLGHCQKFCFPPLTYFFLFITQDATEISSSFWSRIHFPYIHGTSLHFLSSSYKSRISWHWALLLPQRLVIGILR